ncbi:MAG: GTPase, partial [Gammaproteobacteria bacterium]
MRPVIAIMGRHNVGKSTLFNRLTRSRDALVADAPGLTRDRIYGAASHRGRAYLVVDTGGLSDDPCGLGGLVTEQALRAAQEADLVLFVVDAREGLTGRDQSIAIRLRSLGRPIQVVVNKAEAIEDDSAIAEFHSLGLGQPVAVSSAHGQGMDTLLDLAFEALPRMETSVDEDGPHLPGVKIAVVGRPNAGKSTLVNRILGEKRVLVYDQPG